MSSSEKIVIAAELLQQATQKMRQKKRKVTVAESCTGGMLATVLTTLSGSSAWFDMGFVTYSNQAKQKLLNVDAQTLEEHGAVSEEAVRQMALGARMAAKSDYALAISGVAGPTGGSTINPIGTVWFAIATPERIFAEKHFFNGSRRDIRTQAVNQALQLLNNHL